MVKYFMEQANLFQRVKIKPESEISSNISVISGLFHTRYLH